MTKTNIIRIISAILMIAIVVVAGITITKTQRTPEKQKPSTTQAAVKKTEEKAKTGKEDASDKEKTEDAEQTDNKDQKTDDGETKQEAKQNSNTGTSGNGSAGNSGSNQSGGSNGGSGNNASTTQKSATTTTTKAPASPERNYGYASQFLSLLNSYRASLGLSQLGMEGFMQEHCMQRANDLITDFSHNYHGHSPIDGCPYITDQFGDNIPAYLGRGECIGGTMPANPAAMLASFQNSSAHNAILTNPEATHVGVGVVSYNGNDYYCVNTYSPNN